MRKHLRLIGVVMLLALAGVGIAYYEWGVGDDPSTKQSINKIETFNLANGLRVIVAPNHRVPAVSHIIWLSVGATDDPTGKSGLAHYLEHLMFKGTQTVGEGEYSKRIERMGGNQNAFTGPDFTGYYVNVAKEHLEEVMALESDRFQHLQPSQEQGLKERDVIVEERRMRIDNSPPALLMEQVNATLFQHHPYRIPIIGWAHEMKKLEPADALAFYHDYYHPGNMTLVVAGDITADELKPLAERYYGSIPAQPAVDHNWLEEPPQNAEKMVIMHSVQQKQALWSRHYTAPNLVYGDTAHALPLMLLEQWLGGGKTSMLYQSLVEKQKIAINVTANYSPLARGPSQFVISVMPAEGVSMERVSQAVDDALKIPTDTLIDAERLHRAKTLLKADLIYAQDGLQAVGHFVGYLAALGVNLDYYTNWVANIEAITPEQIQQAAEAVFVRTHSVTAHLLPEAGNAPAASDVGAPFTGYGNAEIH